MQRLLVFGAVWALAVARPEQYKEKEDFQFSRSSSDDGTKSGFYGAQRGNMGGNYERAHNMDALAQNQMSGLVRQVEGELGDGARTRTGSVYSAANSRGTYGSGHYDLSNLAGRNFQESHSYGDSQSLSSQSAAYNSAAYANSRSQSSSLNGYQATGYSGLQSDDLQTLDHTQGAGQNAYGYGRQSSHASGYNGQSGYQQHSAYDTSNANLQSGGYGSNVNTRLISATPVRIIVRPGTRVAIPVAAQTYDLTHGTTLIDQQSLNSGAEILNNDNQRTVYRPTTAKHYESSYNYRKEWEKHDTYPSPTTTNNPFPRNSELYEDGQAHTASNQYDTRRVDSQRAQSAYGGYNAVKSTSGQSRLDYDTQRSAHTNANAYSYGTNHQETSGSNGSNGYQSQYNAGRQYGATADSLIQAAHGANAAADLNSQVENLNTRPKSYHSAYSYHKSWERQGDPYVIKPASSGYYDGQSSQRLTSGSAQNSGYSATGSHYQHSHQSGVDCDENGHIRVTRSYNDDAHQEMQQQSQNLEDFSQQQQQQSQNLEDFGQHQQQSQNLEDFGQQQQSQNLEDFGQQQQSQNLEEFGQQQQNLEDFGQQQQSQNLDDFGQQQDGGQQVQNTWDNLENLSQQSQNRWDDVHHVWDKFEDLGQHPHDISQQQTNVEQNNQNDNGQHTHAIKTELNNNTQDQQAQDKWDFSNTSQNEQFNNFNQQETQVQQNDGLFNSLQQSQKQNNNQMAVWDKLDFGSDRNVQQINFKSEHTNSDGNWRIFSQQTGQDQHSLSVNKSSNDEQITNTQQEHEISNTNGDLNSHTNQNNFSIDKNSNSNFTNSHRQEQTTNTETQLHAFETISTNTAPLANVWNKLGNIEQTLLLAGRRNVDQGNAFSQVHNSSQNSYGNTMHAYHYKENTTQEHTNNHDLAHNNDMDIIKNKSNDTKEEKESSLDVGRGDIGPEDLSDLKPDKYPSDIPLSSETTENHNKNSVTNNTNTQHNYQHQENTQYGQHFNGFDRNEKLPEQTSYSQHHYDFQEHRDAENREEQNLHVFSLHEHIEPPNLQDSEEHDNLEQQNLQDFEQQINAEEHGILDFGQQVNEEQQNLHDFGKHDNLEQQNLQDFGQQVNVEQQNLQDFGQQVNVEQQNLQDFGKHDNLEQQNLQDFGQQVNVEQQNLQDFSKHDNLEQQNIQDFGQQVNVEQQNLQDFGKHDNLEQQNLQDFGQHDNLQQQNLQDFGQHDNLQQQNLQDFGQQVNLEQQQVNLEQHNLQSFVSQDDLQQKNENLEQFNQDSDQHFKYSKEERTIVPKSSEQSQTYFSPSEGIEKSIIQKQNNDLQAAQISSTVLPIEPVTESTGFWKSIGNKFSSAKSKIASWF